MKMAEMIINTLHEAVQEMAEFLEPIVVIGAAVYLVAQVVRIWL